MEVNLHIYKDGENHMNIKKSQLVQIIETVVRECIKERKQQLQEAGLTSEKADGQVSPLEDIIRAVIKSGVKGKEAIVKKAHELYKQQMNKKGADKDSMDSVMTTEFPDIKEASYKVVSPNAVDCAAEDKAREIQTDPKVNEASYKVVSPNEVDCADEDKAREIQTDPKVNEASYKVVAPRQATDAKEDKARTIQTEPKVNETAFKKQGPSAKTFKDSPQFPDAVNDPENA
jgi:hypothetical protein